MANQNLLANVALTLATVAILAVVFLGAEWLARQVVDPADEDRRDATSGLHIYSPSLQHKLKPNFSGDYAGAFVTTNARGNRGPIHEGPTSKSRILMLGDSITFGYGVNDDQTFSHLLETNFPGYEVINFGVPEYGTFQSLIQLQGKGLRLKPNWVMLNVCLANDIEDNAGFDGDIENVAEASDVNQFEAPSEQGPGGIVFWLYNNSALVFLINRVMSGEWPVETEPEQSMETEPEQSTIGLEPTTLEPEIIKRTVSLIEQMAAILRKNDIRFLVLLHPHIVPDIPPSSSVEGQLHAALEPTELPVISMSDEYAKRGIDESSIDGIFLDDKFHLSPHGNRITAEIIHDLIAERTERSGHTDPSANLRTELSR